MKKLFALLTTILLVLSLNIYAFASSGEILVDDADLLTYEEEKLLYSQIEEISNSNNISIVIHTTDYIGYKDVRTYAEDFYDNGGYLKDGLIFVISMAERDYFTSTAGFLVDSLPEYQIYALCEPVVPYLSSGNYYEAFSLYLEQLDEYLDNNWYISGEYGHNDNFYYDDGYYDDYYNDSGIVSDGNYYSGSSKRGFELVKFEVIMLIVAVVISVVITTILKKKMNTAIKKQDANDYVVSGSFILKTQYDAFAGSTVTKRPLPKNNNTGSRPGGGGVRMSSGGVRHGGGGGKF